MRQRDSKMFAEILNRLPEGSHTCTIFGMILGYIMFTVPNPKSLVHDSTYVAR